MFGGFQEMTTPKARRVHRPERPAIHFDVPCAEDDSASFCGLEMYECPTNDWNEVTCKNCLKRKPQAGRVK